MIRLFREHNRWEDKLFIRLTIDEWLDIDDDLFLDIDEKYLRKLQELNFQLPGSKRPIYSIRMMKYFGRESILNVWAGIDFGFTPHPSKDTTSLRCTLWEIEDNYFILKVSKLKVSNQYYKCDEWEGVVKCLEEWCLPL